MFSPIQDEEDYETCRMLLAPYIVKLRREAAPIGKEAEREEILKAVDLLNYMDDLYDQEKGLAAARGILGLLSEEDIKRISAKGTPEQAETLINILNVTPRDILPWHRWVMAGLLYPLVDQYFDGACTAEIDQVIANREAI